MISKFAECGKCGKRERDTVAIVVGGLHGHAEGRLLRHPTVGDGLDCRRLVRATGNGDVNRTGNGVTEIQRAGIAVVHDRRHSHHALPRLTRLATIADSLVITG
ncbi:MAG TPA: hypothetical protein VN903_38985, partial [Polyangia bacterium]|nr:hypothetical protein [Polyangia bacterium]